MQVLTSQHSPVRLWLGKYCAPVAWVGLLLAILLPPHGSGISMCWIHNATGIPCPGCGLTRSLSCAVRGMLAESWSYHPFGIFLLALFTFTAVQSLLPIAKKTQLMQLMESRARLLNNLYIVFVVSFIGFGIIRALVHLIARF